MIQEKVTNGLLKINDNGPEGPPSGQIVVEDMVENLDKDNNLLAKSGFDKKKLKSQIFSNKKNEASLNLETIIAPRALVPKILLDKDSNSKRFNEKKKTSLSESKKENIENETTGENENILQLKSSNRSLNEEHKKQEAILNLENKIEFTKQLHLKQIKSQIEV